MKKIKIRPTKKPHTFCLIYSYDIHVAHQINEKNYKEAAENLVKEINDFGLAANLMQRYVYPQYYITFKSKHDAMAFKLKWL